MQKIYQNVIIYTIMTQIMIQNQQRIMHEMRTNACYHGEIYMLELFTVKIL